MKNKALPSHLEIMNLYEKTIKKPASQALRRPPAWIDTCLEGAWQRALYLEEDSSISVTGAVNDSIIEPSELSVAACVMDKLGCEHLFIDGNKRIAWFSGMLILKKIHMSVYATDIEAVDCITSLISSKSKFSARDMVVWMSQRLIESSG